LADTDGDKSHDATPHRRQLAREEGQVARSQDLAQAALLLAGAVGVLMLGGGTAEFLAGYTRQNLGGEAWLTADARFVQDHWQATLRGLSGVVLPLLALSMAAGIALHLAQGGFLFLPAKLAPDLSRVDPLRGLGRVFSLSNLVRLGFSAVKLTVIAAVAYASLAGERERVLALADQSLPQIAAFLAGLLVWTTIKIGGALLALAILDYGFQWWKNEQDLKMTVQELREEMKSTHGDPQIIARRRAVQRQLVLNRLSSSVPKAHVVVTNPTELAVAIQYDAATMQVPVLVAKGAGAIAKRIRQLALEHGIPIIERKPLAQALYRDVELNRPIPTKLYAAVAEVLAFVYRLRGRSANY
jgi:flagellar biosynthesis protein FlhB